MNKIRVHLKIHGKVQGVFYRKSAAQKAISLSLDGWVKNNPEGTVELDVQGEMEHVKSFIVWCYTGPKNALVTKVEQEETALTEYCGFRIIQ